MKPLKVFAIGAEATVRIAFALLAPSAPAYAASYRNPACAKLTFMGIGGEGLMCPDQSASSWTRSYGSQCHDPTLVKICPDGSPRARNDSCD